MNFITRFKMYIAFFGWVILNLINSIKTVIVYIMIFPFCMFSGKITLDVMENIKDHLFIGGKLQKDNSDELELLKELLLDYRKTLLLWTENNIDIFNAPDDRWIINETIKYLEEHNVKIGE